MPTERTNSDLARDDLANAIRPAKMIHRERVPGPDAPMVAYFRAGLCWGVYWRAEQPGAALVGPFRSLDEARRDAERTLKRPTELRLA